MSQNFGFYILNPGGSTPLNNITAPGAIKSNSTVPKTPGKLRRINVQVVGTAGAYSFYDCNFQGAFSDSVQYQTGQGVTFDGNVFLCIAPTLGNATSNAAFWTQLTPALTFPFGDAALAAGGLIAPDWPFANGIYLGAIATGATIAVSID